LFTLESTICLVAHVAAIALLSVYFYKSAFIHFGKLPAGNETVLHTIQ